MRFIPEPRLGIDEENSHAEEYIKYMDAVLEQDKWEKECAERKNNKNVTFCFKLLS